MATSLEEAEAQLLPQEEPGSKADFQDASCENRDGDDSHHEISIGENQRTQAIGPIGALETEPVYLAWREGHGQKPAVGWSRSCGFYRIVGRLFFCLSFLALCLMVHNAICQDISAVLVNLLLSFASGNSEQTQLLLCGLSSYAHKSLSNEVRDMTIENDRFAAMSRSLKQELEVLGPVRERLEELLDCTSGNQEKLHHALQQLSHITNVDAVTSILDAFLEFDKGADARLPGAYLAGEELVNFMGRVRPALETAVPSFPYDDLAAEVFPNIDLSQSRLHTSSEDSPPGRPCQVEGLSYGAVQLLIAVCIRGGDEIPGVSMALLGLLLFSMNLERYARLCCDALVALFGDEYQSLEQAQEDIEGRLQNMGPDGKNSIDLDETLQTVNEFSEMYRRVLHKQPKPEE